MSDRTLERLLTALNARVAPLISKDLGEAVELQESLKLISEKIESIEREMRSISLTQTVQGDNIEELKVLRESGSEASQNFSDTTSLLGMMGVTADTPVTGDNVKKYYTVPAFPIFHSKITARHVCQPGLSSSINKALFNPNSVNHELIYKALEESYGYAVTFKSTHPNEFNELVNKYSYRTNPGYAKITLHITDHMRVMMNLVPIELFSYQSQNSIDGPLGTVFVGGMKPSQLYNNFIRINPILKLQLDSTTLNKYKKYNHGELLTNVKSRKELINNLNSATTVDQLVVVKPGSKHMTNNTIMALSKRGIGEEHGPIHPGIVEHMRDTAHTSMGVNYYNNDGNTTLKYHVPNPDRPNEVLPKGGDGLYFHQPITSIDGVKVNSADMYTINNLTDFITADNMTKSFKSVVSTHNFAIDLKKLTTEFYTDALIRAVQSARHIAETYKEVKHYVDDGGSFPITYTNLVGVNTLVASLEEMGEMVRKCEDVRDKFMDNGLNKRLPLILRNGVKTVFELMNILPGYIVPFVIELPYCDVTPPEIRLMNNSLKIITTKREELIRLEGMRIEDVVLPPRKDGVILAAYAENELYALKRNYHRGRINRLANHIDKLEREHVERYAGREEELKYDAMGREKTNVDNWDYHLNRTTLDNLHALPEGAATDWVKVLSGTCYESLNRSFVVESVKSDQLLVLNVGSGVDSLESEMILDYSRARVRIINTYSIGGADTTLKPKQQGTVSKYSWGKCRSYSSKSNGCAIKLLAVIKNTLATEHLKQVNNDPTLDADYCNDMDCDPLTCNGHKSYVEEWKRYDLLMGVTTCKIVPGFSELQVGEMFNAYGLDVIIHDDEGNVKKSYLIIDKSKRRDTIHRTARLMLKDEHYYLITEYSPKKREGGIFSDEALTLFEKFGGMTEKELAEVVDSEEYERFLELTGGESNDEACKAKTLIKVPVFYDLETVNVTESVLCYGTTIPHNTIPYSACWKIGDENPDDRNDYDFVLQEDPINSPSVLASMLESVKEHYEYMCHKLGKPLTNYLNDKKDESKHPPKMEYVFIAYNGSGFDNHLLYQYLATVKDITIIRAPTKSKITSIYAKFKNYPLYIKVWDPYPIIMASLANTSKAFGLDVGKEDFSHEYIQAGFSENLKIVLTEEEIAKVKSYNICDVELLVKICTKLELEMKDLGIDCGFESGIPSIASLAWNALGEVLSDNKATQALHKESSDSVKARQAAYSEEEIKTNEIKCIPGGIISKDFSYMDWRYANSWSGTMPKPMADWKSDAWCRRGIVAGKVCGDITYPDNTTLPDGEEHVMVDVCSLYPYVMGEKLFGVGGYIQNRGNNPETVKAAFNSVVPIIDDDTTTSMLLKHDCDNVTGDHDLNKFLPAGKPLPFEYLDYITPLKESKGKDGVFIPLIELERDGLSPLQIRMLQYTRDQCCEGLSDEQRKQLIERGHKLILEWEASDEEMPPLSHFKQLEHEFMKVIPTIRDERICKFFLLEMYRSELMDEEQEKSSLKLIDKWRKCKKCSIKLKDAYPKDETSFKEFDACSHCRRHKVMLARKLQVKRDNILLKYKTYEDIPEVKTAPAQGLFECRVNCPVNSFGHSPVATRVMKSGEHPRVDDPEWDNVNSSSNTPGKLSWDKEVKDWVGVLPRCTIEDIINNGGTVEFLGPYMIHTHAAKIFSKYMARMSKMKTDEDEKEVHLRNLVKRMMGKMLLNAVSGKPCQRNFQKKSETFGIHNLSKLEQLTNKLHGESKVATLTRQIEQYKHTDKDRAKALEKKLAKIKARNDPKDWKCSPPRDFDIDQPSGDYLTITYSLDKEEAYNRARAYPSHIAVAIYAYARSHMWNTMFNKTHVYYSDTDSAIIAASALDKIDNVFDPDSVTKPKKELGMWEVEEDGIRDLIVIAPKTYCAFGPRVNDVPYSGEVKHFGMKGVSKRSQLSIDGEVKGLVIDNVKEFFCAINEGSRVYVGNWTFRKNFKDATIWRTDIIKDCSRPL